MSKSITTIKAKIYRLGIKGDFTKLYDLLTDNEKNTIERNLTYLTDEQPILCYYFNSKYWWIITNYRLVIGGKITASHFYRDIVSLEVNDVFELGVTNQECRRIQVISKNESTIDLNLELNTWYAILNLLKFLIIKED